MNPILTFSLFQQTVFYLDEYITAKKGEEVSGTFSMQPNEKNNRDLDFGIKVTFNGELSNVEEENTYRMR